MVVITFNPALVKEFECPNCPNYMLPPVLQCTEGHNMCTDCFKKFGKCTECSSPLSHESSEVMDEIAEYLEFPCKFSKQGCCFKSYYDNVLVHQDFCGYSKQQPKTVVNAEPSHVITKKPVSRKKEKVKKLYIELNPELKEDFKCHLCQLYMLPPILQCTKGHNVCRSCLSDMEICYICLAPVTHDNSQVVEYIADNLEFPCKFENLGCQFKGHFRNVLEHQADCVHNDDDLSETTVTAIFECSLFGEDNDESYVIQNFFNICTI